MDQLQTLNFRLSFLKISLMFNDIRVSKLDRFPYKDVSYMVDRVREILTLICESKASFRFFRTHIGLEKASFWILDALHQRQAELEEKEKQMVNEVVRWAQEQGLVEISDGKIQCVN
jgi:hypothetical protein